MIEPRETPYAKTVDGANIAYEVTGNGPVDLLLVPGGGSHLELAWDVEACATFFRRLASFSRLIRYDLGGTGLSDPLSLSEQPSVEDSVKEMVAVLDAVDCERAAVVANNVGGLFAIFFAASYPNRVSALVLDGCYARLERAPDYPWGFPSEILKTAVASAEQRVGFGDQGIMYQAPHAMRDPEFATQWQRYTRYTGSPAQSKARAEMVVFADVRPVLGSIQAPTLVLHRSDDPWIRKPHAVYLAENIPRAKLVELPGEDNLMFVGDTDALVAEIEEFLTGVRHVPETDRVLATVLFTDIVSSTDHAAELGDRKWRELLDAHDRTVRRQLVRFRGHEVNTSGDGFLATFDGPGRAIECACAIRDAVRALDLEVRAGLHTGEIEIRGDDVAGMAVHIGARVSALAEPGEVLVSGAIPPLVAGSGLDFEYRGEHQLKGVPGYWKAFAIGGEAAGRPA